MKPLPSKLLAYRNALPPAIRNSVQEGNVTRDSSILNKGLGPRPTHLDIELESRDILPQAEVHPILGSWIGVCYEVRSTDNRCTYTPGCFQIEIGSVTSLKIDGTGLDAHGTLAIEGELVDQKKKSSTFSISFKVTSTRWNSHIACSGTYDSSRDIIKGQWHWVTSTAVTETIAVNSTSSEETAEATEDDTTQDEHEDGMEDKDISLDDVNEGLVDSENDFSEESSDAGLSLFQSETSTEEKLLNEFIFTRTPKDVYRFRYLIEHPGQKASGTISRRRWSFAIEAILFRVRLKTGSSNAMKPGLAERVK